MTKKAGDSSRKTPPLFLIIIGLGLIIIAVAVVILIVKDNNPIVRPTGAGPSPRVVSFPAPHLDLVDLSGNPVSLGKFSGQVLLVNN